MMTLDHSFESKEEISHQLKTHLQEVMSLYGYTILNALVTDLSPAQKVKDGQYLLVIFLHRRILINFISLIFLKNCYLAMNEINASKRLKEAAYQRAEGEKIVKVKRAEAEAESMYLSGVGVARQRKAIMDGLRDSIIDFSSDISGSTPKDVMDLLVLNQYFDTLQVCFCFHYYSLLKIIDFRCKLGYWPSSNFKSCLFI